MICIDINPVFLEVLKNIKEFLNSAFISAFLSALAGAAFGVLGAQRVAERSAKRKELADGLKQLNALLIFSISILNQALTLKGQIILPIVQNYLKDREAVNAVNVIALSGGVTQPLKINYQFVIFPTLTLPIEALKNLAYSTQQVSGAELSLVVMIEQASADIASTNSTRNGLIDSFKNTTSTPEVLMQNYFGLQRRDGNTDGMYYDSMTGISLYLDDLIFFSAELATDVQKKAEKLRNDLIKFTKNVPDHQGFDLSEAHNRGLMPAREKYENWLSGFKTNITKKSKHKINDD